jgi:hypothetical protein
MSSRYGWKPASCSTPSRDCRPVRIDCYLRNCRIGVQLTVSFGSTPGSRVNVACSTGRLTSPDLQLGACELQPATLQTRARACVPRKECGATTGSRSRACSNTATSERTPTRQLKSKSSAAAESGPSSQQELLMKINCCDCSSTV